MRPEFKICATCRNLDVEAEGEEFPGILDTAYNVFKCRVYGWTTRENFLMTPPIPEDGIDLVEPPLFNCPSWEEATPD